MKEASEELQRSDSLRPDMPETLYALGRALAVRAPAAAEGPLGRVIAIEKQSPLAGQAYLLLAGIHKKQERTEQPPAKWMNTSAFKFLHPSTKNKKRSSFGLEKEWTCS